MNSAGQRHGAPLRTVVKCSTTTAVPPEMSERSAQTSAMLVEVAGRVPVLGRMPSDMWQVAWEEWLQGWHSPRSRRRSTCVHCARGRTPPLWLTTASTHAQTQSRHSVACTECRDCLGACAEVVQADGEGRHSARGFSTLSQGFEPHTHASGHYPSRVIDHPAGTNRCRAVWPFKTR